MQHAGRKEASYGINGAYEIKKIIVTWIVTRVYEREILVAFCPELDFLYHHQDKKLDSANNAEDGGFHRYFMLRDQQRRQQH